MNSITQPLLQKRAAYWDSLQNLQQGFTIQSWELRPGLKPIPSKWVELKPINRHYALKPCVHRQRLDCELILDFDNKNLALNKKRADEAAAILGSNYELASDAWVTGGKGVHLHTFILGATLPHTRTLFVRVNKILRTKIDAGVMFATRHLIRGEWSIHEKTGGIKHPVGESPNAEYSAGPRINRPTQSTLRELELYSPRINAPAKRAWESPVKTDA